jgi:hypothetical protein
MPMLILMKSACFFVGRADVIIVIEPLANPADPTPAMTRPTMNIGDDWAAPQMADPSSKMIKHERKVHCMISSELFVHAGTTIEL